MSSILKNVVIRQPQRPQIPAGAFRVVSRTDRIIEPGTTTTANGNVKSPPHRCPMCQTPTSEKPDLFAIEGDMFRCTICDTRIRENGSII